MASVKDMVQHLMREQDLSYEDMVCIMAEVKEEQDRKIAEEKAAEAAAKKEAEKRAAERETRIAGPREKYIESMTNYLLALGVINKEDVENADFGEVIEQIKRIEERITAFHMIQQFL